VHTWPPGNVVEAYRIVPPIVVAEGWDLGFYRSEDDLLSHLEPWFPSSCGYRAFDSQGRRLELFADPPIVEKRLLGVEPAEEISLETLLAMATDRGEFLR
jgi:hypothetical protein